MSVVAKGNAGIRIARRVVRDGHFSNVQYIGAYHAMRGKQTKTGMSFRVSRGDYSALIAWQRTNVEGAYHRVGLQSRRITAISVFKNADLFIYWDPDIKENPDIDISKRDRQPKTLQRFLDDLVKDFG